MLKRCSSCGKSKEINKDNFSRDKRKAGHYYLPYCKVCRNHRVKEARKKNIAHYRKQATKRRNSTKYAEGRYHSIGHYGWTYGLEGKLDNSCAWILGNKNFSNTWEKKFHRIDNMFRSVFIKQKNRPKLEKEEYKTVLNRLKYKSDLNELNALEKAKVYAEAYVTYSIANLSSEHYRKDAGIWDKKFHTIVHQMWKGRLR